MKALGILLAVPLLLSPAGQDKSKKTYELLYDDVQFLKQQVQRLEKKLEATSADLADVGTLVRELVGQFKLFQADQARTQENVKSLPLQMQAFLDRLGQIETQILKVSNDLDVLRARPEPAAAQGEEEIPAAKTEGKAPAQKKPATPQDKEKAAQAPEKKEGEKAPPRTNLSEKELYNQALADYQRGSYGLAIDGFKMLRDQFPESPWADDALYMTGESEFSQKKYAPAIEAFDDLIMNYPLSNKIAAAHWKKALALIELKKTNEAAAVLKLLIQKYPLEEEARSAQEKLKELQGIKK